MTASFYINDVIFNYYFLIGGLFLSYLIYKIIHSILSGNNYIQSSKYKFRGHTWRSIQCNKSIPYNIHCIVCGELMLPLAGLFCECCAISACKNCHRAIDKKFTCKTISWPVDKVFQHLWVNVGVNRGDSSDHGEDGLKRFYCCWCQRIKLSNDDNLADTDPCDFQKYKDVIIPPNCVQLENGMVVNIKPVQNDKWEPIIIFANRKSGSNKSDEVLSLFKGLLNPIQVIDLSITSPESVVRWLPQRCRVLAAGGDGTVAWILNALRNAPDIRAPVAILPMGTGNDMSRVLGWGATCDSEIDAHAIIAAVRQATEQTLDRWKLTIKPRRSRLRRNQPEKTLYAYNYASIGVDAQVALDFHYARSQFLYRYASRTLNYMAYALLGAGRAFDGGGCSGLERRLRVKLDARDTLSLPPLQALVLLNIPSWGAGVDLWSMGSDEDVNEQSVNDGKFEVVGISSSFHIARLQCGLAEPYRFAQASKVKIEMSGSCAMQVDGEPWMQGPATITLEPAGQCLMLRATTSEI